MYVKCKNIANCSHNIKKKHTSIEMPYFPHCLVQAFTTSSSIYQQPNGIKYQRRATSEEPAAAARAEDRRDYWLSALNVTIESWQALHKLKTKTILSKGGMIAL